MVNLEHLNVMISVENAINIITNEATQLKDEKISIDKCLGRITSINIYAKINNPPKSKTI